jgi:putative ABC transport system ATP-binding protein
MTDAVRVRAVDVTRSVTTPTGVQHLLAPVSLELTAGELVVVAGPSGSGKTTLCNVLIGWEQPDSGHVEWIDTGRRGWNRCSVSPQRLALLPQLTIRENILVPVWSADDDTPERLDDLARSLQIDTLLDRMPSDVSFGEQQRAAIARALVTTPDVAILDEPTGHQDEARTELTIDALLAARTAGTCVLAASHDPDLIDAADRVITLQRARD